MNSFQHEVSRIKRHSFIVIAIINFTGRNLENTKMFEDCHMIIAYVSHL